MENIKNKTKEIDIIGIIKKIWQDKKTFSIVTAISSVMGVIIALSIPKQFTTNVILAPEVSGTHGLSESLSDIASMVGMDIGGKGASIDAIYPEIYPDVLASSDFIIKLFDTNIRKKKDPKEQTYYQYLSNDQKRPFWVYPMIWVSQIFENDNDSNSQDKLNPFYLTKPQTNIVAIIRSNISCSIDKKTSVITISVKDQDPMVSAIVADTLQNRLQEYITLYRTKKARIDLDYFQKLYDDAKTQYTKSRQIYAAYSDANNELTLQSFKLKMEDLENEMQLKFNVYTQISQQLQMAKAKVQETTPAFTTIQQATVPLLATSTPRSVIVLLCIVLGIVLYGLWIIFGKDLLVKKK